MEGLFAESTKEKNKPSSHDEKKVELSESEGQKDNPWICPFKIWEKNCAFPVLADALEITYDDRVGRHVKATRNIMAGRVHKFTTFIFKKMVNNSCMIKVSLTELFSIPFCTQGEAINEEEAIAAHLSPYKMRTNCVHCFRKTGSSVYPSPWNR